MVSAAGLAPALPRFQAEHVASTPRAVCPDVGEGIGVLGSLDDRTAALDSDSIDEIGKKAEMRGSGDNSNAFMKNFTVDC